MLVKLENLPQFLGVKINKIFEKPPPRDDTGDQAEDR